MRFFENARKPAAVLDIKGTIIKFNDEFHEKFNARKINNIKDLSNEEFIHLWDEKLDQAT